MSHYLVGVKQKVILYDLLRDKTSRQFVSDTEVCAKSGFSTHIVAKDEFVQSTRELDVS